MIKLLYNATIVIVIINNNYNNMFNFKSEIAAKTLRYYSINKKYPLLKEVKKAFELKYGLGDLIANSLKKIKEIKEAYIFGSYAKRNFGAESDIDLLIIGDHDTMKATKTNL